MSSPSRIGLVSCPFGGVPPRSLGSIEHIVHEVATRLHTRHGHAVTVVGGRHSRDPRREHPGVRYVVLSDRRDRVLERLDAWRDRRAGDGRHRFHRPGFGRSFARRAAGQLGDCEVVVSMVFAQWLAHLALLLPDTRRVLWAQDSTFAEIVPPEVLATADLVLGCSKQTASRYEAKAPLLAGRCRVLYNGVDPLVYRPGGVARHPARLCFAGRLTPEKGPHRLVDAFARLAKDYPALELWLVGPAWVSEASLLLGTDPAHRAEIEELCRGDYAAELWRRAGPYRDRMHMPGPYGPHQLRQLYASSTALVHPCLWEEPFGMPVLEAMACGTPVVVSRRGGLPEFVSPGAGDCLESGEVDALVAALRQLLDSPAEVERRGAAAARRAREFSWDRTADDLAAILSELGESPSRQGTGSRPGR